MSGKTLNVSKSSMDGKVTQCCHPLTFIDPVCVLEEGRARCHTGQGMTGRSAAEGFIHDVKNKNGLKLCLTP